MTRELEMALWSHICAGNAAREWVQNAIDKGIIAHPKQAWRTLEKWASKGLYDFGVAIDLGWLLPGAQMPDRRGA